MADTRNFHQDGLHKCNVVAQDEEPINPIVAVLIVVNGGVPLDRVGTADAPSTLSAIFPKTLVNNIAVVFTNVSIPLHWTFLRDIVPDILKGAPHFVLNNPIALQKEYLKLKDDPNMKMGRADLRIAVKAGEENALEMLVDLLDWLEGLEAQPTTEIDRAPMGQTAAKEAKRSAVRRSTCLHLVWGSNLIIIGNRL